MNEIEKAILETKKVITERGIGSLVVDDLKPEDMEHLTWSGSASHMKSVAKALDRAGRGEVEYLVVRSPSGYPISKGGIDYAAHDNAGTLWQLSTIGDLQGLGIGSRLIQEMEKRINNRGLKDAVMGVEEDNPRAKQLYERLGYKVYGQERESWEQEDENGSKSTYHANVILLKRSLN